MPSSLIKFSPDEVAVRLSAAVFGVAPSNALLNSYKAEVVRVGESVFARNLAESTKGMTDAQLTAAVLGNLGISAATIGTAGFAALSPALTTLFAAFGQANRGQIVLNITRLLADLESDVTYGAAAKAWNAGTDAAFAYSSAASSTASAPVANLVVVGGEGFKLTAGVDVASGALFTAVPVYTPGGNNFINSLQDEDRLTGVSEKDVLDVILGSVNDNAETTITPKLSGIETVNLQVTAGAAGAVGLNFQDTVGTTTVNVNRITQTNAAVVLDDMNAQVTNIGVSAVARNGSLTANYKEDTLQSTDGVLNVAINATRLANLNLTEGNDSAEDAGYFFETVNITNTGSSNIDALAIQDNTREDTSTADANQTINITANGALEINRLTATGAEFINLTANADVMIAADEREVLKGANDAVSTGDLRKLVITGSGNVTIDGLDGHIDETAAAARKGDRGTTLVVDASAMTGSLNLGVATAADGNSSAVFATRADKDVSITSGSGNDRIETYTALAGDISTGAGNDTVSINTGADNANGTDNTGETAADVEGVSTISTGAGNDRVTAGNLNATAGDNNQVNNTGFTTVTAASIDTGEGDDTVIVAALNSANDWDNFVLTDGNIDDLFFVKGAAVSTGAGNDAVTVTTVAEGASVMTGAGNDTLTVELGAAGVLAADTDANRTVLNNTAAVNTAGTGTKEVNAAGTAADMLGAVVDLGDGDDAASFNDAVSLATEGQTIVGTDASLGGGAGADVLNVTALDATTVAAATSAADSDPGVTGVQSDVNATITGIETINLTVSNQVVDDGGASATVNETLNNATVNDNVDTDGAIVLDVLRVDSALAAVNLASNETAMLQNPTNEIHSAGTQTSFTLNNHRSGVALTLTANEATGVSGAGALADDRLIAINRDTGVVTVAAASDVTLNLNVANGEAVDNSVALTARAGTGLGDGSFDLTINAGATATDLIADDASTTDDNAARIEGLTVTFDDANSHGVDVGGFGDVVFRGATGRPAAVAGDVSSTAATSLTVNSGAGAGKRIDVTNVNADTIRVNNAAGTAVTAADVTIRVDASNNYNIVTGTGADTVDLRADDLRSDDTLTSVNRADVINLGTGRDVIVVSGNDDVGNNNNIENGVTSSTIIDDDVFGTLTGVEQITVVATGAASNHRITLDEAARATGVDTIRIANGRAADGTAANTYVGNIVLGNNFVVATGADNANGELTAAASAMVIDASAHATGSTTLNIENKDDDSDVDLVNLDVRANATAGAVINFVNTGSEAAAVEVRVTTTATAAVSNVVTSAAPAGDGNVRITVANQPGRSIDKVVIVENAANVTANATATPPVVGTVEAASDTFTIEADWTRADATGANNLFEFDASAIADTDANSATGGATITVEAGDTARLIIKGGANNDTITGGDLADTITGGAGADIVLGGLGADSIDGNAGNDVLVGGAGNDTINGDAGNDTITGGQGADSLTGGDGADTFVINATVESIQSSADTLVGFTTGSDKIQINATVATTGTVNLGRFAAVPGVGEGDNSLDGTTAQPRLFDAFYSTTGQLAIDVDGNGDITDNADIVINSAGAVAAGDVNYALTLQGDGNLVRLGQGVDTLVATGINNTFVIVGSLTAAKAAEYNTAGAALTVPGTLANVVPFNDLLNARTASEANTGDSITAPVGGLGTDVLHVYGVADLSGVTLQGIDTLVVHSAVTITAAQLANIANITFSGNTTHSFNVVNADGTARTPAQITADLTAKNVTVENAGPNTSFLFGAGQTGATTQTLAQVNAVVDNVTATVITSALTDAQVDLVFNGRVAAPPLPALAPAGAGTLTVLGANLSDAAEATVLAGLTKVVDGGISSLTLSAAQFAGTTANSLNPKLSAGGLTVDGTAGADTINLTGYTKGVMVNAGDGNDTVTSGGGADMISLGAGNDTVNIAANTTGVVASGSVISTTNLDKVSGFGAGDTLSLPFVPSSVVTTLAAVTGTAVGVIRGTYSASADAFVASTSGLDSLLVFDADGTGAGSVQQAVVLIGASTLTGSTGSGGFGG